MDATRATTVAYVLGRVAYGAGLIGAPGRVGSAWIGPAANDPTTKVSLRAMGTRDVALALGVLASLEDDDQLVLWIAGCIAGDLTDLAGTLAVPADRLPPRARIGTIALAGGAAALGAGLIAAVKSR